MYSRIIGDVYLRHIRAMYTTADKNLILLHYAVESRKIIIQSAPLHCSTTYILYFGRAAA